MIFDYVCHGTTPLCRAGYTLGSATLPSLSILFRSSDPRWLAVNSRQLVTDQLWIECKLITHSHGSANAMTKVNKVVKVDSLAILPSP